MLLIVFLKLTPRGERKELLVISSSELYVLLCCRYRITSSHIADLQLTSVWRFDPSDYQVRLKMFNLLFYSRYSIIVW